MTLFEFFTLLGGVGLFLFGMSLMSQGLKLAAGNKLRSILEHATANRFVAVAVGILVTLLVQSSSATDMMVISFVNSGLMTLAQAIGVIMGANIGTTVTAQITAFNLSDYAPFILFIGAVLYLFVKKNAIKYTGSIILGFGMLFFGISVIKSAIVPLSKSAAFISFLSTLENPAIAVIFGVLFTALLQSSSSSVVIFQTFTVQGLIGYDMTVYLVIGAAIGSRRRHRVRHPEPSGIADDQQERQAKRRTEPSVQSVPRSPDAHPGHGIPWLHKNDPKSHTRGCRSPGREHAYYFCDTCGPHRVPVCQSDRSAIQESDSVPGG